jgi:RNA polymerase sigma factor (sigma-70 family)
MRTMVEQPGATKAQAHPVHRLTASPPAECLLRTLCEEDRVLLEKLLSEPAEWVRDGDFHLPDIEERLFGAPLRLNGLRSTRFRRERRTFAERPSESRVQTLSSGQERTLFLQYNYARCRAAQLLESLSERRLTAAALRHLLAWGHVALDCRADIVRLNLPLVLAMAKRTRLTSIDFNELVSEGNMALLRSVEKFDSSRGFKFSTYACRAILKSFSRVAMRASRYRGQFPIEFDPAMERSNYLDLKREGVETDCVDELKEILINNLAELSEIERTVIQERFALCRFGPEGHSAPKTLEQVGHIIGVTKERVRQIQNKALRKIRSALEQRFLAA